jgi:HPt (histidine-containing phosphotransfer) domain-containing protein
MAERQYKYINLEYINELADGEPEFLVSIVGTCLSSIPADMGKLGDAITKADYEQIAFYCHKLKGSLNFIGSAEYAAIFETMEVNARRLTGVDQMPAMLADVALYVENVTAELAQVLKDAKD